MINARTPRRREAQRAKLDNLRFSAPWRLCVKAFHELAGERPSMLRNFHNGLSEKPATTRPPADRFRLDRGPIELHQVDFNLNVPARGLGIRANLVSCVHQIPGDVGIQPRQAHI